MTAVAAAGGLSDLLRAYNDADGYHNGHSGHLFKPSYVQQTLKLTGCVMPVPSFPRASPDFQPIFERSACPLLEAGIDLSKSDVASSAGGFGLCPLSLGRFRSQTGGLRPPPLACLLKRCLATQSRLQHVSWRHGPWRWEKHRVNEGGK